MKILDRVPISGRQHLLTVHGDVVQVYRNQIIVWVGIANRSRVFPAILDTKEAFGVDVSEAPWAKVNQEAW